MIGRLVHKADFERALGSPPRSRSAHFALHYVPGAPSTPPRAPRGSGPEVLSTTDAPLRAQSVDKICLHWLGLVIPKRHARRAVTRNLLRRQAGRAMRLRLPVLPPGLWLVRLRQPFRREDFPSAASDALRRVAGSELGMLFQRAV